jgi:hypothetical protein
VAALRVFFEDFGAGDVAGHQVGRELDAFEVELRGFGDALNQQALGRRGSASEQHVAVAEQRDTDVVDGFGLADHDFPERRAEGVVEALDLIQGFGVGHLDFSLLESDVYSARWKCKPRCTWAVETTSMLSFGR